MDARSINITHHLVSDWLDDTDELTGNETDKELDEIADQIEADAVELGYNSGVDREVIDNYLRSLRDIAADRQDAAVSLPVAALRIVVTDPVVHKHLCVNDPATLEQVLCVDPSFDYGHAMAVRRHQQADAAGCDCKKYRAVLMDIYKDAMFQADTSAWARIRARRVAKVLGIDPGDI